MELSECREIEMREDAALVTDSVKEEGVESG